MVVLEILLMAFWVWMIIDFFYRGALAEDFWTMVVFLTPLGALVYFFGYYLPAVREGSGKLSRRRRVKELEALALEGLPAGQSAELAHLCFEAGRHKDAALHYERALEQLPDHHGMRLEFATCLVELRRAADAIPHLMQVAGKAPHYRERATLLLSECLTVTGDWRRALVELEPVARSADSPELQCFYGRCLARNARTEDARTVLTRVVRMASLVSRQDRVWVKEAKELLKKL